MSLLVPKRQIVAKVPGQEEGPPEIIEATITVREQHVDDVVITEHPVEQGTPIDDHAFNQPAVVVVLMGWSASDAKAIGNPTYLNDIYDKVLKMKGQFVPFDLYTGKRVYTNLLIKSLSTETDKKTANVLHLTLVCRELILVSVSGATPPVPTDQQGNPETTASGTDQGTQQTTAVPASGIGATAKAILGLSPASLAGL